MTQQVLIWVIVLAGGCGVAVGYMCGIRDRRKVYFHGAADAVRDLAKTMVSDPSLVDADYCRGLADEFEKKAGSK